MSSAWIGVVGALGGVVITSVVGLATAAVNHGWQEDTRRWERADRLHENRAELRRDAYTSFLIATDAVADLVLTQPVADAKEVDEPDYLNKRLRTLRTNGTHLEEFDAALIHVKLLAGEDVIVALTSFHEWFVRESAAALRQSDALASSSLRDLEEARQPLVEAMKAEQEADLEADAGSSA
jgi:hypothetical protein